MKNKGVIDHMKKNGVKYIYLGPVDNVLLKLADPISLGYMVKNNFDIAVQVDGDGQHDIEFLEKLLVIFSLENLRLLFSHWSHY